MKLEVNKFDLVIRGLGKFALWLNGLLVFIFLYLPIAILIIYSFNASRFNAVWRGFTLDWYRSLLNGISDGRAQITDVMIWDALNNSFIVATLSTLAATVAGTMLALALEKFQFTGRKAVESLLFLPIIIPDIAMGISLLVFFSLGFQLLESLTGIRLVLGLPTVIIGHIAFNISFVTVTVRGRIAELEPSLEEAAWDLGANEWQTLWRVILPLIAPGILSAALLAFTLSLDDFVITFFTTGVGVTTLPLYVYGMIKFSVTPAINAISTLIVLVSFLLVVSSLAVQKRLN
ncbi:ABC transporter permease [Gloeothece verrucosa]|uniref:Binding-protein-dependent transport systems inner membrane component n=1 Tax=Gloeothece verrucosa (strain PCC 7822) TaxID=497965 RepID=E0UAS1_GLOV7|nr:ABC transporter permease [Gloeothece verrucosa]ADN13923.1 binding-protein-dependent transport systems inner membrane component [Gloeothece verrucosa PCC 7822]